MPRPIPKMADEDPLILPPSPHLLMDKSAEGDTCPQVDQAVVITTVAGGVCDDLMALTSSTPSSTIVTTWAPSPSPIVPILTHARLSANLPSNNQEEGNTTRPSQKSKETTTAKITHVSKTSKRPENPSSQGAKWSPQLTTNQQQSAHQHPLSQIKRRKRTRSIERIHMVSNCFNWCCQALLFVSCFNWYF